MAVSYGFFNSTNSDRTYDADDVNTFFEGLISSSGIFANVDNMFAVTVNSDFIVNVAAGKAMINNYWVRSNAVETISLTAASALLNRYDAIVLRLDIANRQIILTTIEGTSATDAVKPSIVRNSSYYDLCLAYVYIPAGSTAITQSHIQDMRLDSNLCGLITSLITQLDTSTFLAQLEAWQEEQQEAFQTWFDDLTEDLNVDTYIECYSKVAQLTSTDNGIVALDMTGYTYSASDVLFISIDGAVASEVYDYLLDTSTDPVEVHLNLTGSSNTPLVDIKALKSKIGSST